MSANDPVPSDGVPQETSDSLLATTIQLGLVIDPRDADTSEDNIIFLDTTKYFVGLSVEYTDKRVSWIGKINFIDVSGFFDQLTRVIGSNQCIIFRYGRVNEIESLPWQRGLMYSPEYRPSPTSLSISYSIMPQAVAEERIYNKAREDFGILSSIAKSIADRSAHAYATGRYSVYVCNSKDPESSIFHIIAKEAKWDLADASGIEDSNRKLPINSEWMSTLTLSNSPPLSLNGLGPSKFVIAKGESFYKTLSDWCSGSYNGSVGNGHFLLNGNANPYRFHVESSGDSKKVFFHTDEWDPVKGVKITTSGQNSAAPAIGSNQPTPPILLAYGYSVSGSSVLSLAVEDTSYTNAFVDYRNLDLFSLDSDKGLVKRMYSKLVRSYENPQAPEIPPADIDTSVAEPAYTADPNSSTLPFPSVDLRSPQQSSIFVPSLSEQYLKDRVTSHILETQSNPLTANCQIVGGKRISIWDRIIIRYVGPSGDENRIISGQYRVTRIVDSFSFNGWTTNLTLVRTGGPPISMPNQTSLIPSQVQDKIQKLFINKSNVPDFGKQFTEAILQYTEQNQ